MKKSFIHETFDLSAKICFRAIDDSQKNDETLEQSPTLQNKVLLDVFTLGDFPMSFIQSSKFVENSQLKKSLGVIEEENSLLFEIKAEIFLPQNFVGKVVSLDVKINSSNDQNNENEQLQFDLEKFHQLFNSQFKKNVEKFSISSSCKVQICCPFSISSISKIISQKGYKTLINIEIENLHPNQSLFLKALNFHLGSTQLKENFEDDVSAKETRKSVEDSISVPPQSGNSNYVPFDASAIFLAAWISSNSENTTIPPFHKISLVLSIIPAYATSHLLLPKNTTGKMTTPLSVMWSLGGRDSHSQSSNVHTGVHTIPWSVEQLPSEEAIVMISGNHKASVGNVYTASVTVKNSSSEGKSYIMYWGKDCVTRPSENDMIPIFPEIEIDFLDPKSEKSISADFLPVKPGLMTLPELHLVDKLNENEVCQLSMTKHRVLVE
eukprot:CAMPEP_0171460376 /NCGR_PEP_ID=MMETSP0945-20130129/5272_1 /TAXON_ID=109269 /ORGANISM="Vaucheria litorea, Strain CCMP2940" /LENGTH=436 /DNA_ID=CAMNT_0011986557 /DNA_START=222 /DNA_END=1529 /DNA_ORIENTATION=+